MLERTCLNITFIVVIMICAVLMVITGDPITRILGLGCAWVMGVATKSIKGN